MGSCWAPLCDLFLSRAAKRGCFKRGGFPIWTCPSFFVLLGLSRGFSRFAPGWSGDFPDLSFSSFPGLLRAPTRNSPERVRDTIWTCPEKSGKHPGLETPRFSFSQFWCLSVWVFLLFDVVVIVVAVVISMPNMTGRAGYWTMEMNGGSSAPCLARTPCVSLFCTLFNRGGNRRAFRLPGVGRDHFNCTVEPSPGRTLCGLLIYFVLFCFCYLLLWWLLICCCC